MTPAIANQRPGDELVGRVDDRAGIATTLSQIGVLLTEKGDVEDAVGYNVRSLALRLDIGPPDTWVNRN